MDRGSRLTRPTPTSRRTLRSETDREKIAEPHTAPGTGTSDNKASSSHSAVLESSTLSSSIPAKQQKEPQSQVPRIPSPTKLPTASLQRSQSVKQPPPGPSLKHVPQFQRQSREVLIRRGFSLRNDAPNALRSRTDSLPPATTSSARQASPTKASTSVFRRPVVEKRTVSGATDPKAASDKHDGKSDITTLRRAGHSTLPKGFSPQVSTGDKVKTDPPKDAPKPVQYSRETFDSTMELLHLHLLHSQSAGTQEEWKADARAKQSRKYSELVALKASLDQREKKMLEQKNAAELIAWANQPGGPILKQRMQTLSKTISFLWRSTNAEGKYTSAIQAFEHWYEGCEDIQRRRSQSGESHVDVIEGLGDGWKAEVKVLQEGLLDAANDVLSLGDTPTAESDLARCVTVISEMLQNMLEELDAVLGIEQTVMLQEQFWVQSAIDGLANGLRG